MSLRADVAALARLEFADILRSRWLVFCGGAYAALAAAFVFVALRESTVLGFTGMGRVLVSFCHALLLALPLLAATATAQTVNQARDSGALELLFSHPFSREGYYLAVTAVRFAALVLPLAALVLAMMLYARVVQGEALPWFFALRTLAVSASLLWAFTGLGLMVSTLVRNQAKALMYALLLWAVGAALLDFALVGLMLQWRLKPAGVFLLASLNPVQAARMALLSAAEPELSVLGPVGFYLSNRVGPQALFVLGTAWPAAAGTLAWLAGFRSFRKGDLV